LHEINKDNRVRLVKFATSRTLIIKIKTFPHRKIRKYTWSSPDGKTTDEIDHVLIDKGWLSSMVDDRSARGGDCY